jgi:spore coat polysaccharide biosynthesis predicted glycosyltransferase SpsG
VDVVINGNVTAKRLGYKKYSEHQLLLLGPQYNMIREDFKNISRRIIKEKAEQIMITTGGSDPYDITGKLVSILLKADCFRNIRINILVGAGFTNHRKLIEDFHNYEQVVFYSNMIEDKSMPFVYSSISNLMLQSDIAMSSGGSTLYEFAACGTPVLAFIMAENQKFLVETMEQLGCVINLGWYNQINEIKLIDMTNQLMNDYVAKVRMSSKCKGIVDALGTERIVKKLTIG